MILHALKDYYDRKAADPESDIAPEGFERKELQYLITIDENGKFISLDDMREKQGARFVGKRFLLPRSKSRSGSRSYETTFLLWDHIGYVLGLPLDDEKSPKQHQTWLTALKNIPQALRGDSGVKAMIRFYETNEIAKVRSMPEITECLSQIQCNMSFRLPHDIPVPCRKAVQEFVVNTLQQDDMEESDEKTKAGICLARGLKPMMAVGRV